MAASLTLEELTQILDAPAVSSEGGRARGYQSPQQWRQSLALDDLEDREGLPRGLLTAVLTRESNGYPTARSRAGAQGLFQLMPATAQAYQADPLNPEQSAAAAAKELGSHYKRYGGDLQQTLAAWNWGSGNLQNKGMANAPKETRNFISWVSGLLGPGSAEAAERPRGPGQATPQAGPLTLEGVEQLLGTPTSGSQQPAQARGVTYEAIYGSSPTPTAGTYTQDDVNDALATLQGQRRSRLDELEAELARRDAQPAPGTYSQTDVDAALRQLRETPSPTRQPTYQDIYGSPPTAPGGTQAQAARAPADEPPTPEWRFLRLPSVQQLPLEARMQRFREFYALRPEFKEEFLRSEEPPSDLTVDIEKPSTPAPRQGPAPAPGRPGWAAEMIEPLSPVGAQAAQAEVHRPAPLPVPPEAAIAALPGMAGYAIGTRLAPLLGPIGRAVPPLLEAAGGFLGHRANVKLGYEEAGVGGDLLSMLPLATRGLGSATAGWLERTVKEVPAPARDELLGALMSLFKRGGAPATLAYALWGDPQLAAWIGGSTAVARQLLEFGLKHPAGKQLVEQTLKAGRAIGGPELGMLMQIGRTGKAPARSGPLSLDELEQRLGTPRRAP